MLIILVSKNDKLEELKR